MAAMTAGAAVASGQASAMEEKAAEEGVTTTTARKESMETANTFPPLRYAFLGVDLIIDKDLRPWLIEVNPMPSICPVSYDQKGNQLKKEVLEDLVQAAFDPVIDLGR